MGKIIYQCDLYGYFVSEVEADESPLEPGVYLIPAGCVELAPPSIPEGKRARWVGGEWTLEDLPGPYVPTPAEVLAAQSIKLQGLIYECNAQKSALTNRISTIQDAIDFEMATPEEEAEQPIRAAQLVLWKKYGVLLGRVTTQAGWPPEVVWPVKPTAGMDLTVSAQAPEAA